MLTAHETYRKSERPTNRTVGLPSSTTNAPTRVPDNKGLEVVSIVASIDDSRAYSPRLSDQGVVHVCVAKIAKIFGPMTCPIQRSENRQDFRFCNLRHSRKSKRSPPKFLANFATEESRSLTSEILGEFRYGGIGFFDVRNSWRISLRRDRVL